MPVTCLYHRSVNYKENYTCMVEHKGGKMQFWTSVLSVRHWGNCKCIYIYMHSQQHAFIMVYIKNNIKTKHIHT